ncbi:MAG: type II secretion system GspH family protein [Rickettsiales bacterium]|jgi:prepilin-type N-terminal cleavage/methylation domain-containing protein|nr:type II secretion system GspH family protein [Rickettsiales bacterium]
MKKNDLGFSLIELSIVLIIMGLLVAGITGGASLIKTAQLRSVITEASTYRTAFNTFYSQFGRVPGSTTEEPVKVVADDAWNDLKNTNIIDKIVSTKDTIPSVASKYKGTFWYIDHAIDDSGDGDLFIVEDFRGLNVLYLSGKSDLTVGALSVIDAAGMDEKLDDGQADGGFMRGISSAETPVPLVTYGTDIKDKTTSVVIKLDF